MSDNMTEVIVPKSDQINADDLISGPITITIERVEIKPVPDQPVSIYFKGSQKVYRPCKSMSRVLVFAWGADAKAYSGRSITIYRDPSVKWGGMEVGGIRISHMSHIDERLAMALTSTKGRRAPFIVQPLKDDATKQEPTRPGLVLKPTPKPVAPVAKPAESDVPFDAPAHTTSATLDETTITKLESVIGEHGPKAADWFIIQKWLEPGQGLEHLKQDRADKILAHPERFMRAVLA